jgi:cytochrome c553
MRSRLAAVRLALPLIAAAPTSLIQQGATIVAHGTASGALPCMACHGDHLQGNPAIGAPRIAGLDPSVTLPTLKAIAAGKMGKNYVMTNIARDLSPTQRQAIAAYLVSLKSGT